MGSFRLGLALVVVLFHLGLLDGTPVPGLGLAAVQVFFVISGFYMAMVLTTTYREQPVRVFYASRLLRLLPVFLVTAAIALWLQADALAALAGILPAQSIAAMVVTNVTMLGTDLAVAFCLPTTYAGCVPPPALPIVPPAWSIGPEVAFYLAAPFLVRSLRGAAVVTVAGAVYLHLTGSIVYPVSGLPFVATTGAEQLRYAFFGASIVYFGLGAAGFHLARGRTPVRVLPALLIVALVLPIPTIVPGPVALALAVFVPWLFGRTQRWRADRFVGELSYPVYLVHAPVFLVMVPWAAERTGLSGVLPMEVWVVTAVLAAALALHVAIQVPVDRFRHSARFRAWAAGRQGPTDRTAMRSPGSRTPRWGSLVAAAWLGLPFLYVGGVVLAQSRQVMTVTEHPIADITDARWERGIGRTSAEIAVVLTPEAQGAFPWYGGAHLADTARWVTGTLVEGDILVVRLEGDTIAPLPSGAPGVVRAVRRAWAP